MMPHMVIVIICMVIMYLWPGMTLWLPNYLTAPETPARERIALFFKTREDWSLR
jgi:hypothetical protein